MTPVALHLAILRTAALLLPPSQRADWLAEWRSELWHARRDPHGLSVAAFCMGAFRDANWLRRNGPIELPGVLGLDLPAPPEGIESFPDQGEPLFAPPARCLSVLAALAGLCFASALLQPAARAVLIGCLSPRNVVMLTPAGRGSPEVTNGFLDPYPTVSHEQFESLKARDGGQFTELEFYTSKRRGTVQNNFTARGFVVGRLRYGTLDDGRFRFVRMPDRSFQLLGIVPPIFLVACILFAVKNSGSGEGRLRMGARGALFLAAKALLVLAIVTFGSLSLGSLGGSISPLFLDAALFTSALGARWILADQRRRCPVCLRLLANPVRIGEPSRILLEWRGTELMCLRGHGLLYVPEWPAIWSGRRQWIDLGPSWNGLFPEAVFLYFLIQCKA